MKRTLASLLLAISLMSAGTVAIASDPVWISAFDNTSLVPNGSIDHRIDPGILSLPMLGPIRFYRIDGGGAFVEFAPYLGVGTTLQDHFNQPWTPTGFETDNYKYLSINTGSRLTTIYIADDSDIVNPAGGPFIRQTQYSGTPAGIITSGYTTDFYWLDHGAATYGAHEFDGSIVYRMDILVVPEPSVFALIGLGLLAFLSSRRNRMQAEAA